LSHEKVVDMTEKQEAWAILIALAVLIGGGYLFAWRGKNPMLRRAAALVAAIVSGVVAYFGTAAYAVPELRDFRDSTVSLKEAVVGNVVVWLICLILWFVAIRLAVFGVRKHSA
jgi:hypothetical protein